MNKNVPVKVMCGKFLTKDDFAALFKTYGIKDDDMTSDEDFFNSIEEE